MAKQTFTTGQVLTAAQMTDLQATAMGGGAASTKTASYSLLSTDAGTTVAMNAAGATTITVDTGLFAAGDTVFIQNVGAGVCTITAGTATVDTAGALALPQYDAGILYFTSASAAIFYDYIQVGAASPLTTKGDLYTFSTSDTRLGVGANGTVLTAASGEATGLQWAASSTGALTKIESESYSAVSSVTVDSVFSATYKAYLVIIENSSGTDGAELRLQFRYGSSTESGANYNNGGFRVKSNQTTVNYGVASATSFNLIDQSLNACALNLYFTSVGNTSEAGRFWGTAIVENTQSIAMMGGRVDANETYTGFVLSVSTGTTTGRYAVYGLAN